MKKVVSLVLILCVVMMSVVAFAEPDAPKRPAQTYTLMSVNPIGVYGTMGNSEAFDWYVRGDEVRVVWQCNGWAMIEYSDGYAYIRSEYLYRPSCKCGCFVTYEEPQTYEVLSKNFLNVREKASKEAKTLGRLYKGDLIQVIATDCNWSAVIYKGRLAFVMTKYIRPYACCDMCSW